MEFRIARTDAALNGPGFYLTRPLPRAAGHVDEQPQRSAQDCHHRAARERRHPAQVVDHPADQRREKPGMLPG
jgi:hypothetical protein